MILFSFTVNNVVELCTNNNTILKSTYQNSLTNLVRECRFLNKDASDSSLVSCSSDSDSSTSSVKSEGTICCALNIEIQHNVTADLKKKTVRFHEITIDRCSTTSSNESKQKKKRELLSSLQSDEKRSSSQQTWYSAKELNAFKKYQKAYAKHLNLIDPNDIDNMLNQFDENLCTEQHYKIVCLRGMEKFIKRNCESSDSSTILTNSSRRKVLYKAILSVQLQQKQRQKHQFESQYIDKDNRICCNDKVTTDYDDELIRAVCIPITMSSVLYAYEIAQKDSYIAIPI